MPPLDKPLCRQKRGLVWGGKNDMYKHRHSGAGRRNGTGMYRLWSKRPQSIEKIGEVRYGSREKPGLTKGIRVIRPTLAHALAV